MERTNGTTDGTFIAPLARPFVLNRGLISYALLEQIRFLYGTATFSRRSTPDGDVLELLYTPNSVLDIVHPRALQRDDPGHEAAGTPAEYAAAGLRPPSLTLWPPDGMPVSPLDDRCWAKAAPSESVHAQYRAIVGMPIDYSRF